MFLKILSPLRVAMEKVVIKRGSFTRPARFMV